MLAFDVERAKLGEKVKLYYCNTFSFNLFIIFQVIDISKIILDRVHITDYR